MSFSFVGDMQILRFILKYSISYTMILQTLPFATPPSSGFSTT